MFQKSYCELSEFFVVFLVETSIQNVVVSNNLTAVSSLQTGKMVSDFFSARSYSNGK